MAVQLLNRVAFTPSSAPGSGTIALPGTALPKYQTIAVAGGTVGNTMYYFVEDGTSWEEGILTYTSTSIGTRSVTMTSAGNSTPLSLSSSCAIYTGLTIECLNYLLGLYALLGASVNFSQIGAGTPGSGNFTTGGFSSTLTCAAAVGITGQTNAVGKMILSNGQADWQGSSAIAIQNASATYTFGQSIYQTGVTAGAASLWRVDSTTPGYVTIYYQTSQVGSITTNGSATAYNTTSDYRLKSALAPIVDPRAQLMALRPGEFYFLADAAKTTMHGFIAHEADDAAPNAHAVTGAKDATRIAVNVAVDVDGAFVAENISEQIWLDHWDATADYAHPDLHKAMRVIPEMARIVPQSMDASKLVPLLTANVQMLTEEVVLLKRQIIQLLASK